MIEAARVLATDGDLKFQFRFVGDGAERARLRDIAAQKNLLNVRFESAVPKQEVYTVLQEADVLLVTTRNIDLYEYGLSFNKLFDYLAAGRPIVFGASCPCNPVDEANAGIVVPPEDSEAMAKAIRNLATMSPHQRWEMGVRGRRFAEEHYDIRRLAERMEEAMLAAQGLVECV
jgi:glycosyltransferase involved in cell wall biosynthesis